jgi:predicted TIM-barrel fold metal-dependent hydrolase
LEKIDIFPHILPRKYNEALLKRAKPSYHLEVNRLRPALTDLGIRFKVMDKFEGLRQVMTLGSPPLEHGLSPKDAMELARMANDEMAELVNKYPDRFVGAAASLPLNNLNGSLREADRAIKDLKFNGVQIFSSINGEPLDRPEFLPLYEMMSQYDLPIWIHPQKEDNFPDYPDEKFSKYGLLIPLRWPYETTLAMARLVYSGVMERFPNLKFIAHHCGAMLPFFFKRVPPAIQAGEVMELSKPPLEYFKKFYVDTVLGGNIPALMCGYAFFGADHMLFGSDYPYPGGAERGDILLGDIIESVERMNIPEEEKAKIFSKNAKRILKLS